MDNGNINDCTTSSGTSNCAVRCSRQSSDDIHEQADESEGGYEPPRSILTRFAYNAVSFHDPTQRPCISRTASLSGYNSTGGKKSIHTKYSRFLSDITDAQLEKLTKCVACQVKWRTRKSSAQKILHLQACSKKNSLTEQTMQVLIRRDIEKKSETVGKSKITASKYSKRETLLETLVENTDARKSKRRDVYNAVEPVNVAQTEILHRAQQLFNTPLSPSFPKETSAHDEHTALPSTQYLEEVISGGGIICYLLMV
ncbi:hypothetical protein BDQ17DRAFT_1539329 [Cyathus striatus]|nr:hypothetical protein BDQ17DRAFT_1539329 [Cyathus striatus]